MAAEEPTRILIVDDEEVVLRSISRLLEDEGYAPLTATTPKRALELMESAEEVPLALLDLSLPGMSGTELAGRLNEVQPQLKVVLFTGYAGSKFDLPNLRAVISKPVDADDLLATLARVLAED